MHANGGKCGSNLIRLFRGWNEMIWIKLLAWCLKHVTAHWILIQNTKAQSQTHTHQRNLFTQETPSTTGDDYRWPTLVRHPPGSKWPCVISSPFQAQWNARVARNTAINHLTRGAEQHPQFSSFSLSASPPSYPTKVGFHFLAPLAWTGSRF